MLAVFGLDPAEVLVDMVVVDSDRMTGFSDPATVSTGPGDAIIMIDNSHANAGQGYHQSTLVQLSGGQSLAIDTTLMLDLLVCGLRLAAGAAPDHQPRYHRQPAVAADGAGDGTGDDR